MMSFESYAQTLRERAAAVPAVIEGVVIRGSVKMTALAQSYIGILQTEWDPLADSTKADKRRKGYGGPPDYQPGLRTGEMRGDYEPIILPDTGGVANSSKKALWYEIGTSKQPPRPVTAKAVLEGMPSVEADLIEKSAELLTIEE